MSKILEQNHVGFGSGSEKIIPDPQTRKLALKVKCSYHNSCAYRSAAEPCKYEACNVDMRRVLQWTKVEREGYTYQLCS